MDCALYQAQKFFMRLLQGNKQTLRKFSSIDRLNSLNKFTDEEELIRETGTNIRGY